MLCGYSKIYKHIFTHSCTECQSQLVFDTFLTIMDPCRVNNTQSQRYKRKNSAQPDHSTIVLKSREIPKKNKKLKKVGLSVDDTLVIRLVVVCEPGRWLGGCLFWGLNWYY